MSDHASSTGSPPRSHRRLRRLRLGVLVGLSLMLVATPAMVVVALAGGADWAFIVALATFAAGLVTVGGVIAPGRSSFHGGTKIWQNDGLPGGGAGGV
jgi:hypothetical protein